MFSTGKTSCYLKYYSHFVTYFGKFKYLGEIYSFHPKDYVDYLKLTGLGHCDLVLLMNGCPPQILEPIVMQPNYGFSVHNPVNIFKGTERVLYIVAFFAVIEH